MSNERLMMCPEECVHLSITEEQQIEKRDRHDILELHRCKRYNVQLHHGKYHPEIMRYDRCDGPVIIDDNIISDYNTHTHPMMDDRDMSNKRTCPDNCVHRAHCDGPVIADDADIIETVPASDEVWPMSFDPSKANLVTEVTDVKEVDTAWISRNQPFMIRGSMWHNLKTWPEYFEAVLRGDKPFEVRRNDRDYRLGDYLVLDEWDPGTKSYTGRRLVRTITYIMCGDQFGIESGYVVLGVRPV